MSDTGSDANLPRLKHRIALSEEDGKVVLDISDETGGLGVKLYLDLVVASRLGAAMAEKARHAVSKASDDRERSLSLIFNSQANINVSVGEAV